MGKVNKFTFRNSVFYISVFSVLLSNVAVPINAHGCEVCDEEIDLSDDYIDFTGIEEYQQAFEEFDLEAEEDENCECQKKGFLKKWCKKAKRWFKKSTTKLIKKLIPKDKFKSADHCAYEVAKFKRAVDLKVHNTGSIENILCEFDKIDDPYVKLDMDAFSNRIRYYYHNPHARPNHRIHKLAAPSEREKDILDDAPPRAIIGGVSIACGVLVVILPLPGCQKLGGTLITAGCGMVAEAYMSKYEEEHKKD